MLQSDHGPEFGKWFVERIKKSHRYTRIGKPNDNAHNERFNRTIQEECLDHVPRNVEKINLALKEYLITTILNDCTWEFHFSPQYNY